MTWGEINVPPHASLSRAFSSNGGVVGVTRDSFAVVWENGTSNAGRKAAAIVFLVGLVVTTLAIRADVRGGGDDES